MTTQEQLTQAQLMERIQQMESWGMTEEQIASALGLTPEPQQSDYYNSEPDYSADMPEMSFDLSDFSEDAVFKQQPDKPNFFKAREKLKPFKELFQLNSDQEFVLNGITRKVKKLNVRDVMRLTSKVPKWAAYLGYNAPKMLVDEYSGQYRWTETILALAERAFGDYDVDLDRPTDFSLSVVEEVALLLGIKSKEIDNQDPVDYLLSCDPEEVYNGVAVLISYNKTFFLRMWNMLGPIKELVSLIFGKISNSIKSLKENQILEKSVMSLSLNETSE